MAGIWTMFRFSGFGLGRGAGDQGPDTIRRFVSGPRRPAPRQKSEPETRSIVRIRVTSALFRAQIRPMERRADHGRPPQAASCRELPPDTHPICKQGQQTQRQCCDLLLPVQISCLARPEHGRTPQVVEPSPTLDEIGPHLVEAIQCQPKSV